MPQIIPNKKLSIDTLKEFFSDPDKILPYVQGVRYFAGEIMACNFSEEYRLYFITEGNFNVYYYTDEGSQLFIRTCKPVMMAGEVEFFLHAWPDLDTPQQKDAYFEMMTSCTMIALNYKGIEDLLLQDCRFLSTACRFLLEKFIYFGDIEIAANLSSSEARLAAHLLSKADAEGKWQENQRMAAQLLRISYRHMHRILKAFIDEGRISRIPGGYQIADRKKLKEKYMSTAN